MCDDLGYGDLQCYNPKSIIQTPHLNQMAKAGIRFTRFYSAAPVCSPTRGSCLTGRHPYRYGVYFANTGHLPTKEITIPELLKPLRYQSGHFGKWHLGTLTKTVKDANRGGPNGAKHFSTPSMHGFDDSLVTESKVPTFDPLRSPIKASKNAWNALLKDEPSDFYGTRFWNHQLQQVQDNLDGDTSRIVMDRAIPFMKQAISVGQPFFATIWFHAPHLPVVASPKHTKAYKEYGTYDKNYFGCITAMDEQVGRLRQFLNEMQIEKDTMIWFCSDNGPEGDAGKAPGSAIHLRGRKRSLYEGGVRVPGILVWPEHLESTSMPTPCVTSDILPSIIDLLDINYPDSRDLDGISLFPIINGEKTLRDSPIGFQSSKQLAWHEENLKLYSPNQGKTWELYDLEKDPSESTNIAIKNQQRVNEMKIRLMNWIKSCQASDQGQDY
jgi:arylsulfatase A-like enzyme